VSPPSGADTQLNANAQLETLR